MTNGRVVIRRKVRKRLRLKKGFSKTFVKMMAMTPFGIYDTWWVMGATAPQCLYRTLAMPSRRMDDLHKCLCGHRVSSRCKPIELTVKEMALLVARVGLQ